MNLVKIIGRCVWLGLGVEYSLHTVLREQLEGTVGSWVLTIWQNGKKICCSKNFLGGSLAINLQILNT